MDLETLLTIWASGHGIIKRRLHMLGGVGALPAAPPGAPVPPPAPLVLNPFPAARLNNPTVIQPPIRLKWIGPLFAQRFQRAGYRTLGQILHRLTSRPRADNTRWLKNRLSNARALACTNDRGRSALFGRAPHQYRVRSVNWFAYNAIVTWARRQVAAGTRAFSRIPYPLQPERARAAFPNRC